MKVLKYLTFDSLREGVGASQALAYVKEISKHRKVEIVSFEKSLPSIDEVGEIEHLNLNWTPIPFGKFGSVGGLIRVIKMSQHVDRDDLVHARGNLAGFAAICRFNRNLIWDCRSLQADQRRALSTSPYKNIAFLIERLIETLLAKFSKQIITITNAVVPILSQRYGISTGKITTISTCTNTAIFYPLNSHVNTPIRILIPGTFSPAYDIALMNKIIKKLRVIRKIRLIVALSPGYANNWEGLDFDEVISKPHDEMPDLIRSSDLGMSVWKNNLGVCLTSVASTKTAEFLACGKPVILNLSQGDFGELVREKRIGVSTVGSSNSEIDTYVSEILELLEDSSISTRCREVALDNLSLDKAIPKLLDIYSHMDPENLFYPK